MPEYAYNFWRSVTAIRAGDTDGNPATDPDPTWMSLIVTSAIPRLYIRPQYLQRCGRGGLVAFLGNAKSSVLDHLERLAECRPGL